MSPIKAGLKVEDAGSPVRLAECTTVTAVVVLIAADVALVGTEVVLVVADTTSARAGEGVDVLV